MSVRERQTRIIEDTYRVLRGAERGPACIAACVTSRMSDRASSDDLSCTDRLGRRVDEDAADEAEDRVDERSLVDDRLAGRVVGMFADGDQPDADEADRAARRITPSLTAMVSS